MDGVAADAPILFFDSGVGGLSIARTVRAAMPDAPVVYCADTAGYPYGTRHETEIAARVPALLGRLVERYRPRLVVIACNTASTIALGPVRAALKVPVVGTVPAIKPAAAATRNGRIGVLGTQATVRQPYVDDLAARFAAGHVVVRHGAPALVDLAEAKLRGDAVDPDAIAAAAAPLVAAGVDTIVLACTHFPLLRDELATAFPPGTIFVDGADGIARRVVHLTQGQRFTPAPALAVETGPGAPDADFWRAQGFDAVATL